MAIKNMMIQGPRFIVPTNDLWDVPLKKCFGEKSTNRREGKSGQINEQWVFFDDARKSLAKVNCVTDKFVKPALQWFVCLNSDINSRTQKIITKHVRATN